MKNNKQIKPGSLVRYDRVGKILSDPLGRNKMLGVVTDILPADHGAVIHWSTGNRKLERLSDLVVLS